MRAPSVVVAYAGAAVAAALSFAAAGALLALTLPYSIWDAFSLGAWSRSIAEGGSASPFSTGPMGSSRPLFYELQGALWSVTGVSFGAGRLLSLAFGLVFLVAVWLLVRNATGDRLAAWLAVLLAVAIRTLSTDTLAGMTDVPAAALVAATAAVATIRREARRADLATAVLSLLAVLTKPTCLVALVPFAVVLALVEARRRRAVAVAAGLGAGLAYDLVMALHFHDGLISYLQNGTSDGLWALRASAARGHAFLDVSVLGPGLRLPLAFGLVYAALRACRLRHRPAALAGAAAALAWSLAGPAVAGQGDGSFSTAEAGTAFVGFGVLLAAFVLADEEDAPPTAPLAAGLALALPPLALWVYSTAYVDRLASAAWAGAVLLMALPLAAGVRRLGRSGGTFALAPLPLALVAVWISLASLDGLHGHEWVEVRGLGIGGLGDRERTMNIVLPDVQEALATARPSLDGGRLITADPRFAFFLPGRVDTATPLHCRDVAADRVLVLSMSDESAYIARHADGLATPAQWTACRKPPVTLLSQDSSFAVFRVGN